MTQAAKAQEPSMEEILASIRRIIADDDAAKTPAKAAEPAKPAAPPRPAAPQPPPRPAAAAPPPAASAANSQDDIDAMFGSFDAPDTAPAAAPEPAQPDILDLTEAMEASAADPAGFQTIDGRADVVFNEPAPPPPVANTVTEARRQFQQSMPDRSLLAPSTTAAVDSAFNTLAQTVLVKNARTLDEMVAEMLRPMLKAWLDDNLPGMVERIVRDEIERVSRGRAGPH
jgi:cell pole-organizing protein PopZ